MPQDFNPKPGDSIALFGHEYVVPPHPQMPSMAYRQKAGRARVYQLRDDQLAQYFALKQFKKLYRKPTLIDSYRNLHRVEDFDGLRVASRRIVLPTDPPAQRHPNLQYAMLMPWIHGTTWFDVLGQAREDGGGYPDPATAIGLCDRFLEIMEGLEEAGMAHTDVSPGNVMVGFDPIDVQLLDLEDMYMPGASTPPEQNTGSTGYSHRGGETTWRAEGDRYAAAVLAAEMLILADPDLAREATDEGFFTNHCHTPEGMSRFRQARPWLEEVAPGFARVFERSWYADTLEGCPRISELRAPMKKLAVRPLRTQGPKRAETPISRQPSTGSKVPLGTTETPAVEGTPGRTARDPPRPPRSGRRRQVIGVLSVVAIVVGLIAGVAYSLTGEDGAGGGGAPTEPQEAEVPPVEDVDEQEARDRLEEAGFAVEVRREEGPVESAGRVLEQSPAAGERAREGSEVLLTVGEEPQVARVPDMVGLTYPEAEAALEEADIPLGGVDSVPSDTVPEGVVVAQDQPPGTELEPGTYVYLTTSIEPPEAGGTGVQQAPSPPEEAARAVEKIYNTAAAGDYEASYNLLSQGFRQRAGVSSPDAWGDLFSTLQSIEFEQGPDAQVSGDTATVTGVVIATHTDRTERNTVTWTLVNEGGEWKLDGLNMEDSQFL